MVVSFDPTWTSVTAEIDFLGQSVGELQDFTVDEQFNVQRMIAIGSPVDIKHVPGIYQANITSRRAFLDMNILFSAMTTLDASQIPASGLVTSTGTSSTVDIDALKAAIQNTTLATGMVIASLDFDIVLYEKLLDPTTKVATKSHKYTFNSCTVGSRNMTMSSGNIILMENVTILARSRSMGSGISGEGVL